MANSEATEIFIKALNKHHNSLVQSLSNLIKALATPEKDNKILTANNALNSLKYLNDILDGSHKPQWTDSLSLHLDRFIDTPDGYASNLNVALMNFFPYVKEHNWNNYLEDKNTILDIDEIYQKYRDASNLPTLFDKIITILEELGSSNDIDSKAMVKALEKLLKTLKKSKEGSFISVKSAWEFLKLFLENYIISELEKIPALGSLIVALINTTNEMQDEIAELDKKLENETRNAFEQEIISLPRGSSAYVNYDRNAKLAIPSCLSEFNQKV